MSQLSSGNSFSSPRPHSVFAVVSSLIALAGFVVAVRIQERRSTATFEIQRVQQQFHACMAQWTPEMGMHSPCPKIQDRTNIELLRLFDVNNATMSTVARKIGDPISVYENGKYHGTYYCKHDEYWTVMCPGCVMLLPRDSQYDSLMALSIGYWQCHEVKATVFADVIASQGRFK